MRRLLLLVGAIVLVDTALYAAVVPLLPHYAHRYGLSKTGAGILIASFAVGTLLASVPGGLAAARFGPKRAVLVGLALMTVACLGFALADSPWTLGLARFVQGLGSALSWAGSLAWLMAVAPRERRGALLGTALSAAIVGALCGPVLGAVAGAIGPGRLFVGVGVVGALLLLAAGRTERPVEALEGPGSIRSALRDAALPRGLWLVGLPSILFGVLIVLVPLELAAHGFGPVEIGAVFVAGPALEAFISPVVGRASDRHGRLAPLRLALVAATVVSLAFASTTWPVVVIPLVVVAAISYGSFWAPALALISDAAERVGLSQGIAFGLMNGAWALGNVVGPALGGLLAQTSGNALPFILGAGLCLGTLVLVRPTTLRV